MPGRSGQVSDVIIDSSGSFVGIVVVLLCVKLLATKKQKRGIKSL